MRLGADHARRPAEFILGILPGVRRHPALAAFSPAPSMRRCHYSGRHIPRPEAKSKGIITPSSTATAGRRRGACPDAGGAERAAGGRCATQGHTESPHLFQETGMAIARRARGFKAPWNYHQCVQALRAAVRRGHEARARAVPRLLTSSESAAQRYYFFAEREAAKVLDVPADTPQAPSKPPASSAPAPWAADRMNFANAGIPVTLLEVSRRRSTRPQDHPHQLREHCQARRHEGRDVENAWR